MPEVDANALAGESEVVEEQVAAPTEETTEEGKTAAESEPAEGEQEKQERDDEGRFKKKSESDGVQRRIDKLTAKMREQERRAQELERRLAEKDSQAAKPAEASAKPTPDKFSTYEEYVEALTDWKTEQKLSTALKAEKEQAAKQREAEKHSVALKAWNESVAAAQKAHADYQDAIQEAAEEIESGDRAPLPDAIFNAIQETDSKAEIFYHLAKNRADYDALVKTSGARVLIELGKIEAKLANPVQEKPKVTAAPKPPSTVSGRAKGSFDPNDPNISTAEWMKREAERIRKR